MALIKCPECGSEISDKALQCIKCGYPINSPHVATVINFEQTALFRVKCSVECDGKTYTCKAGESVEIQFHFLPAN